jgi:hypothetical protein
MGHPRPHPVAADSVHVWRGFRAPGKAFADFATFLGTVFVPACSLLQPKAGLRAYLPSLPSPANKPATVPDQTALMFWENQQAYANAFLTPAVRAYTNLHGDVYGPGSVADFPQPFGGSITAEQSYHLLDSPADWMLGSVRHLVGGRNTAQLPPAFLAAIGTWAASFRSKAPSGIDAALLCAGQDYVMYWEHWKEGQAVTNSPLEALAAMVTPFLSKTAQTVAPGGGLWDVWPGWDLTQFDCMNVQLQRPEAIGDLKEPAK